MRKVTSLFLALLLVLALTPAFAESANLSEPGVLPIWTGDEPYTLTVLIPQRPEVADYKDNDLTRWIESSCNVNLEFEYLPSDDANQKLAIMINSGQIQPALLPHVRELAPQAGFLFQGDAAPDRLGHRRHAFRPLIP